MLQLTKIAQLLRLSTAPKQPRRGPRKSARPVLMEAMEPRLLLSVTVPGTDDAGAPAAIIELDKAGYAPGETAFITASNFAPGEALALAVREGTTLLDEWNVVDGSDDDLDGLVDGSIKTSWVVPNDSPGHTYLASATGASSSLFDDAPLAGLVTWVQAVPTDYVPGDIANIFAGGFQVGETVQFEIANLTNNYVYTPPWSVVDGSVDDLDGATDGHIQTGWLVPEDALNTTLRVDAMGLGSGLTATNTFTDARTVTSATLNGLTSVNVAGGASIAAVMNVTTDSGGGNQNWRSARWVISTTAPTTGTGTLFNFEPDHDGDGSYSESFSITAPTSAGTYNAYFVAYSDDGGNNQPSNIYTLTNAVVVSAPSFVISDVTANEGNGATSNFTFSVSLANAVVGATYSVQYATANGTAFTGDSDYAGIATTTLSGFSTITPTKTFSVSVNGDIKVEANENFFVNLSNALKTLGGGSNPGIADAQGQGTILNDDTATYAIDSVSVTEGGNLVFTVTLDNPVDVATTLNVSFAGGSAGAGDYASATQQVNFAANSTTAQQVSVATTTDSTVEADETFIASLALSAPLAGGRLSNTADTGTGTIVDNDTSTVMSTATVQYSDRVLFSATIGTGVTANISGSVAFEVYVGGVWVQYASATVTNQATPATVTATTPAQVLLAPATYQTRAVFTSTTSAYGGSVSVNSTLTVNKEDARASYTGLNFVTTSSASSSTATVLLSATIQDITATAAAAGDTAFGDIRNATVTFINRDNNTVIAANVPVGLVNALDTKTGTASVNWNVNIGTQTSATYTIGVIVNHYYTRNDSGDNTVILVAKPVAGSINGGGFLVNTAANASNGAYAGAVDAKTNFGLNVKFNKQGTNLQGNVNIIVRGMNGTIYQIKSNAIDSLNITSPQAGWTAATFTSKANVTDITNPLAPNPLGGNKQLQITMIDKGEPGSSDTIGITLTDSGGGLLFSSSWSGTKTLEKILNGGNLQVRSALVVEGLIPADGSAADVGLNQVQPIFEAAKSAWLATGLSPVQTQAMRALTVQTDSLSDGDLGWQSANLITIDTDAAGHGWFIDATPGDNSEFNARSLFASSGAAAGRMDMLSVLVHEIGHAIGLDHSEDGAMAETLRPGQRSLAEGSTSTPVSAQRAAGWLFDSTGQRAQQAEADVALPLIDWNLNKTARRLPASDASVAKRWVDDFVNHAGASAEQRNPNLGLKVSASASVAVSKAWRSL